MESRSTSARVPVRLLRIGGYAALLSAVTTFLLWLLPCLVVRDSNDVVGASLATDTVYLARWVVNLIHMPLAMASYTAFAYLIWLRGKTEVIFGWICFLIWSIVELIGVSMILFAVNLQWRKAYAAADAVTRVTLESKIGLVLEVWDALFFLLLCAFLLGSMVYASAADSNTWLERAMKFTFWLGVPLTLLIILSGYFGYSGGDAITATIYPLLQPLNRVLLGVWLLTQATELRRAVQRA